MRTHKIIGAVEFLNDDGKKVGEVRGMAQQHAYAMAAAPDLLAACESALEMAEYLDDKWPYSGDNFAEMVDLLKAAIAKAKGE